MPRSEEKRRGLKYYRTIVLPGGKYIHVAVVRKLGPRGGHTIAGPVHKKKERRGRHGRKRPKAKK